MAEMTPEQLENINKINAALEKQNQIVSDLQAQKAQAQKSGGVWSPESEAQLNQAIESLNDLKEKLDNITPSSEKLKRSAEILGKKLAALGPIGKNLANTFTKGLSQSFVKVASTVLVASSAIGNKLLDPMKSADEIIGGFKGLGILQRSMKTFLEIQAVSREHFISLGKSVKKADTLSKEYNNSLMKLAAHTGISSKTLIKMAQVTQGLPGYMKASQEEIDKFSSSLGEYKDMAHATGAANAMLGMAAKAMGMDMAAGAEMGVKTSFDFGQSHLALISDMGKISTAAGKFGIQQKKAYEQISNASGALAIFGRGVGSATNMWTTFNTALKNKVPITEVGKMVTKLTGSLARMSIQNRAFISMMSDMSRGASALGGGLKMELAMRSEGGMEKQLQGLTKSLARFGGGRVITLEQAANNPQLEMQFQLQRQMLGKLTNISNQEQQNRILETLGQVQSGGMSQIEGSKTIGKMLREGGSIQKKRLTFMERSLDYLRTMAGWNLNNEMRVLHKALMGTAGGGTGTFGQLDVATRNIGGKEHPLSAPGFIEAMRSVGDNIKPEVIKDRVISGQKLISRPAKGKVAEALNAVVTGHHTGKLPGPPKIIKSARTPTHSLDIIKKQEGQKLQIMNNLLTSVKAIGARPITEPPAEREIAARTEEGVLARREAAAGNPTSTIIIKIESEPGKANEKLVQYLKDWPLGYPI